jgi:hypothetical protein
MKNVISMMAAGGYAYAEMADVCVQSLRTKGKFTGEIKIFTNLDLSPYEFIRSECTAAKVESFSNITKTLIPEWSEPYDQLMYIDVDCIAIDDINPFFEYKPDKIRFSEQWKMPMTGPDFSAWLTSKEKIRAADRNGVNGGFFVTPQGKISELCHHWSALINQQYKNDQWALNALVLRDMFDIDFFPDHWVEFPLIAEELNQIQDRVLEENKILHFCSNRCDKMDQLIAMKKTLRSGHIPYPLLPQDTLEDVPRKVPLMFQKKEPGHQLCTNPDFAQGQL